MEEIAEAFEDLDDPRTGNAKRHLPHEILIMALCTVPCGGETRADMSLIGRSRPESTSTAKNRSSATLQKFASIHASVHNHFDPERQFYDRENFKLNRNAAVAEWRQLAV